MAKAKKKGSEVGDVVRYVPAPEPMFMVIVLTILTLVELVFAGLFIWGFSTGVNDPTWQQYLAFWLGSAFLALAAILAIYRRYFLPDVMIVKKRKPKYEDLL